MYAIVKVGGKQYRVEKGDSLLVDRMPEDAGAKVALEPLLLAPDGKDEPVFRTDDLGKVSVEATVTGHERGPKLHVLKFKPKRGYKRRQGHRSELTRLEIGEIKGPGVKAAPAKKATQAKPKQAAPAKTQGDKLEEPAKAKAQATKPAPAAKPEPAEPAKTQGDKLGDAAQTKATPARKKPAPKEDSDGS